MCARHRKTLSTYQYARHSRAEMRGVMYGGGGGVAVIQVKTAKGRGEFCWLLVASILSNIFFTSSYKQGFQT